MIRAGEARVAASGTGEFPKRGEWVHLSTEMQRAFRNAAQLVLFCSAGTGRPARNSATGFALQIHRTNRPLRSHKPKPQSQRKTSDSAIAPDQPTWDPLRAEKDCRWASILHAERRRGRGDRPLSGCDRQRNRVTRLPFRILGEAQEKKGLKKQAIKSYKSVSGFVSERRRQRQSSEKDRKAL